MLYIFDKQKICSYLVASTTVIILIAVSIFLNNEKEKNESVETWSSSEKTNIINGVEINGKNILITMKNEANENEARKILNALENV